jgi:hypothetical protein
MLGNGLFVTEMIHDHVELSDDSRIMYITASVDLCEDQSSLLGPSLGNEPAGRFGSEIRSDPLWATHKNGSMTMQMMAKMA